MAVATVVVVLVLARGSGAGLGASVRPTAASSLPASSSATAPECQLRVLESGFTNRYGPLDGGRNTPAQGQIQLGLVLENPCQQAAVDIRLIAEARDASGKTIPFDDGFSNAGASLSLPVLLPGQRIGMAGQMVNNRASGSAAGSYDATRVAALTVRIDPVRWRAVTEMPEQVSAAASGAVLGARRADGSAPVSFTLRLNPLRLTGIEWACFIVRDAAGRIVSGDLTRMQLPHDPSPSGDTVHSEIWVPSATPGLHVDIYAMPAGFL
jgi:hypothetical protein